MTIGWAGGVSVRVQHCRGVLQSFISGKHDVEAGSSHMMCEFRRKGV